jgi:hypothetical protein
MEYKVKALTVSGLGKKIHRSGDVVTEKDFPQGRAKELVKSGFLEEITNTEITKEVAPKNESVVDDKNPTETVEKNTDNESILDKIAKGNTPKKTGKK